MPAKPAAPESVLQDFAKPSKAWWGIPALVIPLVTGLLLSWHSLGDLDIWFHLRAGSDLVAGQGIVAGNRYSFTEPDHPYVNHEWMFQALAALTGPSRAVSADGGTEIAVTGWNLMRAVLAFLLTGALLVRDGGWPRLRGRHGPVAAAWAGIPVLVGLTMIWPRLTIRPELFSYLFFIALVPGVERVFGNLRPGVHASAGDSDAPFFRWTDCLDPRRPAGRLVLLTVVWAQFHGFASLVPVLLLLGWLLAPVQARLKPFGQTGQAGASRRLGLLVTGLSIAALAVTPNGLAGLLMPLRALGQFSQSQVDLRTTVSELVPLQDSPNSLGLTITLYRASLAWGLIWIVATFGRVGLLRIIVFGIAAAAAWSNQRSIGFYGLAFVLLHSGAGAHPWRFRLPGRPFARRPAVTAAAGLVVTLLAGGLWWPQIVGDDFYLREGVGRRFGAGITPAHFPVKAAAALAERTDLAVFANLDAAAFLLGSTPVRPYIDGRTEAYSTALWSEYHTIKRGGPSAFDILARRSVESVCLATGSGAFTLLARQLLESDRWRLTHAEGAGLLFQPGPPGADRIGILESAAQKTLAMAGEAGPARNADFCLAAGRLFEFAANEAKRESAYRQGLEFKTNHPTLHHNLGNLLLNRNEFREALPHFLAALEVNPRLVGSALNAGVCQMRLGNPTEAVRSFGRAAALDAGRFEAWVNLSSAHLAAGNREGAVAALEKAIEIRPRDARLKQRLREIGGNRPGR